MPRPKSLPAASLYVVLALLDGELHGYAVMRRVEELSDGAVHMGPGTLYGTIDRLVAGGLIQETTDRSPRPDGERRRSYELTAGGRASAFDELCDGHPERSGLALEALCSAPEYLYDSRVLAALEMVLDRRGLLDDQLC